MGCVTVRPLSWPLIRVGNDEYAKANQGYGLTTLKAKHVAIEGTEVRFQFIGKSGRRWSLPMRDRRVARIIRACQELPGQHLLQYFDEDGQLRAVSSGDVNDYLRSIAGYEVTAKDFRTWAGTVLAARFLKKAGAFESKTRAKRALRATIGRVAAALSNTSAVCRKSYIHPKVVSAWMAGQLNARDEAGGTSAPRRTRCARDFAGLAIDRSRSVISTRDKGYTGAARSLITPLTGRIPRCLHRRGSKSPHRFPHPGDEGAAGSLGGYVEVVERETWLWPCRW